jgi:hypothetical protein
MVAGIVVAIDDRGMQKAEVRDLGYRFIDIVLTNSIHMSLVRNSLTQPESSYAQSQIVLGEYF